MRNTEEIQRAHDILHSLLTERPDLAKTARTFDRVSAACSALCWVLEHGHNRSFPELLAAVELEFAAVGAVLQRSPVPFVGRPPGTDDDPRADLRAFQFAQVWTRLADLGVCDGPLGAQFRRVLKLWLAADGADPEAFIRQEANKPPPPTL